MAVPAVLVIWDSSDGRFRRRRGHHEMFRANQSKTEGFVNLFRGSHRVSKFSWLLLGLGLCFCLSSSYRVRELLICWLFFIGIFATLAMATTGGILAWYGGKYVLDRTSPLAQIVRRHKRPAGSNFKFVEIS